MYSILFGGKRLVNEKMFTITKNFCFKSVLKVYKAISDILENHKIIKCNLVSITLNYQIYELFNFGWVLCMQKIINTVNP